MIQTTGNYGWICPLCGHGNSPYSFKCDCPGLPIYSVTTTITDVGDQFWPPDQTAPKKFNRKKFEKAAKAAAEVLHKEGRI